jgi:protein-tyrosine phosphatase
LLGARLRAILRRPMIDLHCHILPGLDDGPDGLHDSVSMASGLKEAGFKHVFATPHLPWGSATVDTAGFRTRADALIEAVSSEEPEIRLSLAAEHFSDLVLELLHQDALICYPRGDTFLMEFPLSGFPPRLQDLLFRLQVKAKIPVIAHVERYPDVQQDLSAVEQLKERGCYLLVNLTGLAGAWSKAAQKTAVELVKSGLIDAATTDLHGLSGLEDVREGIRVLTEIVGEKAAHDMLEVTPAEIAGI